jgi:integrase/recombinase XerD
MRLAEATRDYVASKRSVGMVFETAAGILRAFTRIAGPRTSISKVPSDVVQRFLSSHGPGAGYWNQKQYVLYGFWTFAIQRGLTDWCPVPTRPLKDPRLFVPHIYTHEELRCLIDGIATCQRRWCKLEPISFRTIFLLLYGGGLRIGEVVRLTCADVDLIDDTLTVRCTKFYKTRRIALSSQLCKVLAEYDANRREAGHDRCDDAPFFVYKNGERATRHTVEETFWRLRQHVGIGPKKGRHQPRLHDLRHTFAVHRLIAWYRNGADVQRLLPGLSTHLGHVDLASTQQYLTMTPELLVEASLRFEHYAGEVGRG